MQHPNFRFFKCTGPRDSRTPRSPSGAAPCRRPGRPWGSEWYSIIKIKSDLSWTENKRKFGFWKILTLAGITGFVAIKKGTPFYPTGCFLKNYWIISTKYRQNSNIYHFQSEQIKSGWGTPRRDSSSTRCKLPLFTRSEIFSEKKIDKIEHEYD